MFGYFQYSVATNCKSCIHLKREHFSRYTHCIRFNIHYFCSAYFCLCHQINKDEMWHVWERREIAYRVLLLNLESINVPSTHFCYSLNRPLGHSAAGRIKSMKYSNDTFGIQTHNLLPHCLNQLHHHVHANSPLSHICHFHFILIDLMTIIKFSKYEKFT
jgi:hypothetical protein